MKTIDKWINILLLKKNFYLNKNIEICKYCNEPFNHQNFGYPKNDVWTLFYNQRRWFNKLENIHYLRNF